MSRARAPARDALPSQTSEGIARREWTSTDAAAADALPYVDALPQGDWRARVDQLVAEEVRRRPRSRVARDGRDARLTPRRAR